MKYIPTNTLAYLKAAQQTRLQELGGLPFSVIGYSARDFKQAISSSKIPMVTPDPEAVSFYALNHCVSILLKKFTVNEPLPEWAAKAMNQYVLGLASQTERLAHYMLCIVTREARHLKAPSVTLTKAVKENFGPAIWDFIDSNRGGHESAAVTKMGSAPPDCTIRQYLGGIAWVFDHGSWSGGFGGKPWGQITKCLLSALDGKTTFEMMVDTAYTLAHNNGPMFNKGMMYNNHTHSLIMVLDIQRSGQIPELLLDTENWTGLELPDSTRQIVKDVEAAEPGSFGQYVDWDRVMALGAVQNYSNQNAKQKKKHPVSKPSLFMGKPATSTGTFEIFPAQEITIYQRKAA